MSIKEKWAKEIAEQVRNGASESDVLALLWTYIEEEVDDKTRYDLDASIVNAEKAKRYDELKAKIAACYEDDEFEEEGDGLISIGEIAASHFGFM